MTAFFFFVIGALATISAMSIFNLVKIHDKAERLESELDARVAFHSETMQLLEEANAKIKAANLRIKENEAKHLQERCNMERMLEMVLDG